MQTLSSSRVLRLRFWNLNLATVEDQLTVTGAIQTLLSHYFVEISVKLADFYSIALPHEALYDVLEQSETAILLTEYLILSEFAAS